MHVDVPMIRTATIRKKRIMIKYLEKSARTEDEAIQAALDELKMDRDDVSVEILERAKSGFLGIGATNAVVKVSYEVPDEVKPKKASQKKSQPKKAKKEPKKVEEKKETAPKKEPVKKAPVEENDEKKEIREFLNGLFDRMGIKADIEISDREGGGVNVNLAGPNVGAIIGRRGETLDAIQHLTNYVINRGSDKKAHINIDAESYRAKREESLTRLAEKMAEKAIKYKRSMALEPMNSYERHVIHTALQNYEGVTTSSSGEEPNRRVVVSYVKGDSEQSNKPKVKEWA